MNGKHLPRPARRPLATCSRRDLLKLGLGLLGVGWTKAGCARSAPAPIATPTPDPRPTISGVTSNRTDAPAYELIELAVDLNADYENPFDARQVTLTGTFQGPTGRAWAIPGFWDAQDTWRVRFAPTAAGTWRYRVTVRDHNGESKPFEGKFTVTASNHHGWLRVANWVKPDYSPRYLAHADGTPFYGLGQCDAIDLMSYGFDADKGLTLFTTMQTYGLNTLVYWPIYSDPFFNTSYDDYNHANLARLDTVVRDAERKGIYLIWTIWDHGLLRDKTHPWRNGQWGSNNGFRKLGDVQNFFTNDEAWAWQANLYRYHIARWGFSPAIGMWMTVSEIEGTNVGELKDTWHQKVNAYFVKNDPYRHPTTASMAGDADWPAGYAVMDVPQAHSYASRSDVVGTGTEIANRTRRMWYAQAKPNVIGEFGTPAAINNPEHFHNGIWAGMAAGAAITPLAWNDSSEWGKMTPTLFEHLAHLGKFVADVPFAKLNPTLLDVQSTDADVRAWGVGGKTWAIAWVQDVSLAGRPVDEVRQALKPRRARLTVRGLANGNYRVRPYDTWRGVYVNESAAPSSGGTLTLDLPEFKGDVAVRIEHTTK